MFLKGACLIVDSLQDSARVSKSAGVSGAGSLGNSWLSCDGKTSYSYADKMDESLHNSAILAVESAQNQNGQTKIKLLEMTCTHFCFTCCTACGYWSEDT